MKLIIRRSTIVNTDIELDLDKEWERLKSAISSTSNDDSLDIADLSSKETFISNLKDEEISPSDLFYFLQNNNVGATLKADEYSDENFNIRFE